MNFARPTTASRLPRFSHATRVRPVAFWGISIAAAAIFLYTPNSYLTSAALIVPAILVTLVWRPGEPPVLLFGCLFQWLQASAAIFYTNHLGVTLEQAFGSNRLTIATWLSLAAVVALAIGIRLSWWRLREPREDLLAADGASVDIKKVAALYGVALVVSTILMKLSGVLPSIAQPLEAVAAIKWAFVFMLCYAVLEQRRDYGLLVMCVLLEFGLGLFGVFAQFKSVFFVLAIAAMSSSLAFRGSRLAANISCFVILFVLGVVWSAVKMDYRSYMADESMSDEVIPLESRVTKLADLVDSLTWDNITDGVDALVLRVSYVNFFAITIENVPSRIPYENGELWKESVIHVLTPRFLFPNKAALDDSERTREYTGMNVSGMESGTSIGIGYVGESYIDFGPIWMFMPIICLGALYGLIYRLFLVRSRYPLLGGSLAVACLVFNCYEIETSNIKLVGAVMASGLVSGVIYAVAASPTVAFLRRSRSAAPIMGLAPVPQAGSSH